MVEQVAVKQKQILAQQEHILTQQQQIIAGQQQILAQQEHILTQILAWFSEHSASTSQKIPPGAAGSAHTERLE